MAGPIFDQCLKNACPLDKRPKMYKIPFWEDTRYPSNADAYMIQDAIDHQLLR
jgi:hypothetical protein